MAGDSIPMATLIHMITIKLSSSNYLLWKNQVVPVLASHDLLGFVDGTVPPPPATLTDESGKVSPNPDYTTWYAKDQRILSLLQSSLTEESMAEVIGASSSRAVWLALEAAFSHDSESRAHQLREELQMLKKGTLSVAEYGRKFKLLCDQLAAIGRPVDNSDKTHWFLRGLGSQFTSFSDVRMALTPRPALRDLIHQAQSFELFSRSTESSEPVQAAFTVQNRGADGRGSRASHSSNRGGGRNGSRGRGRRNYVPKCQMCGIEGHFADRCPNRFDRTFFRNNGAAANLAQAFGANCNISSERTSDWFLDTGASAHITSDTSTLDSCVPYSGNDHVVVGNGASLSISHTGKCQLTNNLCLLDVLVVPHITKNLLSISKLTSDYPVDVLFSNKSFAIQNRATKDIIARGKCDQGLYILEQGHPTFVAALHSKVLQASFELWHSRLGHVNFSIIELLNKLGHLSVTSVLPTPRICSPCQLAKSKRLSFDLNEKRASTVLQLVHCDLWGHAPVRSFDGFLYYVIFVDDFSRFTWLYPLRAKSDFYDVLVQFHAFVCNQFSCTIKSFQSDGGTEFTNARVKEFFARHGIHHRISCPYTPEQNGRAERKHRHITETGLSMMFHAHIPGTFWLDAFSTAAYIINRLPSPLLNNKSPFELLYNVTPNYKNFKTFGCRVFPYLRNYASNKLEPRSRPCIFLGYSSSYKGFRCYDPHTSRVFITRHAQFDECSFHFSGNSNNSSSSQLDLSSFFEPQYTPRMLPQATPMPTSTPSPVSKQPTTSEPCSICENSTGDPTSPAACTPSPPSSPPQSAVNLQPNPPPISTHPMTTRSKAGISKRKYFVDIASTKLLTALATSTIPKGFKSATKHPEWVAAMEEEIKALHNNDTWDLIPCPKNANVVGSKWVFRIKYHSDGSIERHKARLVAQGFTQLPEVDFSHTFSPVVKAATVRIILALAVQHNWALHQLDVKNAFLNGLLTKPVFMAQPPGFVDPRFPHHVCRLKKALYGLKQAPLAWFQRFSTFLYTLGFCCSRADTSLFYYTRGSSTIYLLVYVDDIIITGNDNSLISRLISRVHKEFAIKDLGRLNYFLGLEVTHTDNGLFLGQAKYAQEILSRANLLESKPVATPLAAGESLTSNGSAFNDPTLYRSLVGALQYLTITRPDLSYAVNYVSQYLQSPTDDHFQAVKRILRYVKGTIHFGLTFTRSNDPSLIGYSDADWARCLETRRSTYGYSIFLGGNLVSWSAKKQPTVARSSCESEYRALANAAAEVVWVSHLLQEIRALPRARPLLLCDNKSAIFLSQNPVAHKRAKHIDLDYHFVRELVSAEKLITQFVPSHLQVADIFTKSLARPSFEFLRSKLRVGPNPTLCLRGGDKA